MKLMLAAFTVTFAVAIAASVVAVWASVADAPWEDTEELNSFSEEEVIGLVRADVGVSRCLTFRKWAAEPQGGAVWIVATTCGQDVPSLDPRTPGTAVWSFRLASQQVIPLNSLAEELDWCRYFAYECS